MDTRDGDTKRRSYYDDIPDLPHPQKPVASPEPIAEKEPLPEPSQPRVRHIKKRHPKRWIMAGIIVLLLASSGTGIFLYLHQNKGPVPKAISTSVAFPIYYPDIQKLPSGYSLDLDSFSKPIKDGVAYTVGYEGTKKIVFSVQPNLSDNEMVTFRANYIPLRIDFDTPLGKAEMGAYKSQTLVSLPVLNGSWVVATAPSDINQDQLKQVLRSLKSSR